ncbi:peptidoglycan D,D-transpeptidase FtsI family protein [Dichotomicrobium thermohalophilum]|uniref:Cell division protein FtsI (Penicillin-binding protein 3) n=1 Tax=Dichotomicrobium thermohalophilum TaxID=933063 RepID=A0A397PGY5_9HYPH|nr:penicillin-binding protein 2 [Dichotomicrobium thermohalophilum]RIA47753.1 cell division protein FtsI (penicillin-binding protein 3) [Dichotomicrobium thermohalophilum]
MTAQPKRRRGGRPDAARIGLVLGALFLGFAGLAARLISLGVEPDGGPQIAVAQPDAQRSASRPDLVDRKGRMLATDLQVYWAYGDPARVVDVDDAAEKLARVLPDQDIATLRKKLSGDGRFVWLYRGLTPKQAQAVHRLGLPGVGLLTENQRVYPSGATGVHVLGHTNVDNRGIAGIEKFVDGAGDLAEPAASPDERPKVRLALDLGVQHIMREELRRAHETYEARAVAGLVMDVHSGEMLAMTSLPDYDPNHREESLKPHRQNRLVADTYEMGSVFKAFTVAMALDHGIIQLDDRYNIKKPVNVGGFRIADKHARSTYATVPEIFIRSSNTGAARIALDVGGYRQREFLERLGLLEPLDTELPPTADPQVPKVWRESTTVTVSYGHGIAVAPLNFAAAGAALVNGGYLVQPTFLKRSRSEGRRLAEKVLRSSTSDAMRRLLRRNVREGTGRNAQVAGYRLGGKTGTANKPVAGGYSRKKVISTFFAAFPMDDPQYLVLVMIDEPKPTKAAHRRTEAAWNAAPTVAAVVKRAAPILGVAPERAFDEVAGTAY